MCSLTRDCVLFLACPSAQPTATLCSLTIECVFLLENVFFYQRMCSLTRECVFFLACPSGQPTATRAPAASNAGKACTELCGSSTKQIFRSGTQLQLCRPRVKTKPIARPKGLRRRSASTRRVLFAKRAPPPDPPLRTPGATATPTATAFTTGGHTSRRVASCDNNCTTKN